ncbi:MAG: DMT family transporter [Epulopiscium sp.]|nr:DMT family transporter [Candidatus Epulonipiscium sp.]
MELTWFTFAIVATFCWGLSDVFFKKGTDPDDKYGHLRILIMIGLIMGLHAMIELQKLNWQYDIKNIISYFPVSFLYILSMAIDFYGYRYLLISVGSPVASTSGAMAGILSFKVLGKTMSGVQFFAVSLITLGLVLLAILEGKETKKEGLQNSKPKNKKNKLGAIALLFPIVYSLLDGVGTFLDDVYLSKYFTPEEALISFELTFCIVAILSLFYIIVVKKQGYKLVNEKYNIYGGLFETAGQFFYVYALNSNSVVAAPLMSVDSIVAVIFGRIYLKEKLTKKQYFTIIMISLGVFILGFYE